jgi:microcompartment protein CcmK/EutM
MRIARVMGVVVLGRQVPELRPGRYVMLEVLDGQALQGLAEHAPRRTPMPESLVAFDQLGVGVGQIVAVSEGAEATMPFRPDKVPLDAYCTAILDKVELTIREN